MSKDYYNILGVGKTASKEEIKKAFREKAHLFHPDKPGGDEKKFKEINEAYQVLGNDEKRQQYDQFGSDFAQQGGFGGGMGWEDIMRQAQQGGFGFGDFSAGGGSAYGGDMGDLGDILGGMFGGGFGGGGRRKKTTRGRDIEIDLYLDFKEAVFGADKQIEMTKLQTCEHCNGNGAEPGSKINTCKTCEGQGSVRKVQRTILGNIQTMAHCSDCQGEGKVNEKNCVKCDGQGRIKDQNKLEIKVPAGIDNGMTLKMTGAGEAGIKGGKTGDLYIHIHVKADPAFKRQGDDILSQAEIPFSLAALGGKIMVKTIDGEVDLKIPSGTQSGKVFILRGKGVTRFQHYGKGDHLVEVIVKTPDKLSKRQKELLEELGKEGI